jgi:hypothetical protein
MHSYDQVGDFMVRFGVSACHGPRVSELISKVQCGFPVNHACVLLGTSPCVTISMPYRNSSGMRSTSVGLETTRSTM